MRLLPRSGERTLAYAGFPGTRQYLSVGNLKADDPVALILVDYPNRRRLKVWGHARLVDIAEDADLVARLHDAAYKARPERAVLITVAALDWNCQQHLPQRYPLDELEDRQRTRLTSTHNCETRMPFT